MSPIEKQAETVKPMPISKKPSKATEANIKQNVPNKKGVYELISFGEVKYVGSSSDLQERLLTHHRERKPNKYRYKTVGFLKSKAKVEREHYDRHVEKHGQPPEWNDKRP
ncbi:hypothetical protein ACOJIV_17555 [Haloarcula sp. AONF1]